MKPEINKLWANALRSGTYQKTTGQLREGNCFCVLGVLCDLHAKATGHTWSMGYYLGNFAALPTVVADWAGLPRCKVPLVLVDRERMSLVTANDSLNLPFSVLADIIEDPARFICKPQEE